MSTLTKALIFGVVTTFVATAFATSYVDNARLVHASATASNEAAIRVVVLGHRMTALEKTQYDAKQLEK